LASAEFTSQLQVWVYACLAKKRCRTNLASQAFTHLWLRQAGGAGKHIAPPFAQSGACLFMDIQGLFFFFYSRESPRWPHTHRWSKHLRNQGDTCDRQTPRCAINRLESLRILINMRHDVKTSLNGSGFYTGVQVSLAGREARWGVVSAVRRIISVRMENTVVLMIVASRPLGCCPRIR